MYKLIELDKLPFNYKLSKLSDQGSEILLYGNAEKYTFEEFKKKQNTIQPHGSIYCLESAKENQIKQFNTIFKESESALAAANLIFKTPLFQSFQPVETLKQISSSLKNHVDEQYLEQIKLAYYEVIDNIKIHNQKFYITKRKNEQIGEIFVYEKKGILFLLAIDFFGSLTKQDLINSIFSEVKIKQRKTKLGAGIGLNLTYHHSSILGFNIFQDFKTSVLIGHLPKVKSKLKRDDFGKILFIDLHS